MKIKKNRFLSITSLVLSNVDQWEGYLGHDRFFNYVHGVIILIKQSGSKSDDLIRSQLI